MRQSLSINSVELFKITK